MLPPGTSDGDFYVACNLLEAFTSLSDFDAISAWTMKQLVGKADVDFLLNDLIPTIDASSGTTTQGSQSTTPVTAQIVSYTNTATYAVNCPPPPWPVTINGQTIQDTSVTLITASVFQINYLSNTYYLYGHDVLNNIDITNDLQFAIFFSGTVICKVDGKNAITISTLLMYNSNDAIWAFIPPVASGISIPGGLIVQVSGNLRSTSIAAYTADQTFSNSSLTMLQSQMTLTIQITSTPTKSGSLRNVAAANGINTATFTVGTVPFPFNPCVFFL